MYAPVRELYCGCVVVDLVSAEGFIGSGAYSRTGAFLYISPGRSFMHSGIFSLVLGGRNLFISGGLSGEVGSPNIFLSRFGTEDSVFLTLED
jgi:hypothetical protein